MATTTAGVTLTIPQAAGFAKSAGFSGNNEVIILSIAIAESGLNTHAINSSDPFGGSFGILQINGSHFGDKFGPNGQYTMGQSVAFEPSLAFLFSWELSNYGKDFTPWGTYTSGAYLSPVQAVKDALAGPQSLQQPFPPYSGSPWYAFNIYSDFPATGYNNTDVGDPADTPLTAPLSGTITELGYFDWGGQITIKVDQPSANNGYKDYFLIHLDAINPYLRKGQHIDAGTFLGYSGGEISLSDPRLKSLPAGLKHHITQPTHSTGPHLDIGAVNSDTGSDVDNSAADKAASDHLVLLARSLQLPFSTSDYLGSGGTTSPDLSIPPPGTGDIPGFSGTSAEGRRDIPAMAHNTLVQWPGFYGIADALDQLESFPGFINDMSFSGGGVGDAIGEALQLPGQALQSIADTVIGNTVPLVIRGGLVIVGMFLVAALLWQLAKPNLEALPELLKLTGAFAA